MNTFTQNIPKYITCKKPKPIQFNTTKDLLCLREINRFEEYGKFSHFAKSNNDIIAIYDYGFSWFVIGHIKNIQDIDLPLWEGPQYREG